MRLSADVKNEHHLAVYEQKQSVPAIMHKGIVWHASKRCKTAH
jgi:hypothetical protein